MEKDLKYLFIDELHDLLSAEEQIVEALPEVARASQSSDLKNAFQSHLQETKQQIQRLEKIFKLLKIEKKEKFCKGTKGLIQECQEVLKDFKTKSPIRDAALIAKTQRIEHYEISAYGTARTFAKELNLDEIADLLDETLEEEESADKKLSKLAEGGLFTSGINQQAIAKEGTKSKNSENSKNQKSTQKTKKQATTEKKTRKQATTPRTTKNTSTTKHKAATNKKSSKK